MTIECGPLPTVQDLRSLLLAHWLPLVPPLELNAGDGSLLRVGLKQSLLKFHIFID